MFYNRKNLNNDTHSTKIINNNSYWSLTGISGTHFLIKLYFYAFDCTFMMIHVNTLIFIYDTLKY